MYKVTDPILYKMKKKRRCTASAPVKCLAYVRHFCRFKTRRIIFVVIILIIFFHNLINLPKKDLCDYSLCHPTVKNKVNLKYVTIHIDLKGAPPKTDYLLSLLPSLKELGVNSLLMEYEDMFPYGGSIANISSHSCYKKKELKTLLLTAAKLNIEVIPLLQLFGNMEYILKLEEFEHLREHPLDPRYFCPSQDYFWVVSEILTQVITFHNKVTPLKHIHIGCKEASHIVSCERCRKKFMKNSSILIEHMKLVGRKIKDLSPEATILLWDDIVRHLSEQNDMPEVTTLVLGDLFKVEPVVWDPSPILSKRSSYTYLHKVMELYHRAFNNIWIAPAFKGVDFTVHGREVMIPDLKKRLINTLNWLHFIQDYVFPNENVTFDFKGVVFSGWSRKNYFSPVNELLPVSTRTLTSSLRLVEKFRNGVQRETSVEKYTLSDWNKVYKKYFVDIHTELKSCGVVTKGSGLARGKKDISPVCRINNRLTYDMYKTMLSYERFLKDFTKMLTIDPNVMKIFNYTCMAQMVLYYKRISHELNENLNNFENKLEILMAEFFDKDVIDEYLGFKSHTPKTLAYRYLSSLSKILSPNVWKRGRELPGYTEFKNIHNIIYQV